MTGFGESTESSLSWLPVMGGAGASFADSAVVVAVPVAFGIAAGLEEDGEAEIDEND